MTFISYNIIINRTLISVVCDIFSFMFWNMLHVSRSCSRRFSGFLELCFETASIFLLSINYAAETMNESTLDKCVKTKTLNWKKLKLSVFMNWHLIPCYKRNTDSSQWTGRSRVRHHQCRRIVARGIEFPVLTPDLCVVWKLLLSTSFKTTSEHFKMSLVSSFIAQ